MRAFTAVDVEDRQLLQKLVRIREELDYGFNPVEPAKMHVTLEFFKDIPWGSQEEIVEALRKISIEPFEAEVRGVGVFPSRDYVRVVWAGVESEKFYELEEQASRHPVESSNDHEFKPHITLSRVENISRRHKKKFREKLEEFEGRNIGTLEVDSVKLFESRQTGNGTEYVELKEVAL